LRLRRVDIVVEWVLVDQVGMMLLLPLRRRRRRRSVVVVEVMKALVRVLAWVGRIGGDGLHHVGQWCWPSTRSLRSSRRAISTRLLRADGSMDERRR